MHCCLYSDGTTRTHKCTLMGGPWQAKGSRLRKSMENEVHTTKLEARSALVKKEDPTTSTPTMVSPPRQHCQGSGNAYRRGAFNRHMLRSMYPPSFSQKLEMHTGGGGQQAHALGRGIRPKPSTRAAMLSLRMPMSDRFLCFIKQRLPSTTSTRHSRGAQSHGCRAPERADAALDCSLGTSACLPQKASENPADPHAD